MRAFTLSLLTSAALIVTLASAAAAPAIIATAPLTGSSAGEGADLSGLTGTLENGLPANILGGFGSGIAYAKDGTLLALPDRGPNATPFNAKVDETVTFIPRFNTIALTFAPSAAGAATPFTLKAELTNTTLLWNPTALYYGSGEGLDIGSGVPAENAEGKFYFTGRSDAADPTKNSCNPDNARLDSEGIRMSNDGKSVFISDEYGPYLYQFDAATGARIKAFTLPEGLCVPKVNPLKDVEIKGNTTGRTTNMGMEGLAISPDGKTLVGVVQAATLQDAADDASKKLIRIVTVDIASGQTHEYGYKLTDGSGVSEILAINDHQFLLDERDGAGMGDGGTAKVKKLYSIDLNGAQDITDLTGKAAADAAVAKIEFMDLLPALAAVGIDADHVPSKIEGIAFGPDLKAADGTMQHTLLIANDNDFLPEKAGPNMLFVVGFTDADLPGLQMQAFDK